jgi:hypothetical protein
MAKIFRNYFLMLSKFQLKIEVQNNAGKMESPCWPPSVAGKMKCENE